MAKALIPDNTPRIAVTTQDQGIIPGLDEALDAFSGQWCTDSISEHLALEIRTEILSTWGILPDTPEIRERVKQRVHSMLYKHYRRD